MQYPVCITQGAVCSVQYTVCSVHYSVQCAICDAQCAVCNTQCAVCITVCSVQYPGGATTTGPDATHPPAIRQNSGGGGGGGGQGVVLGGGQLGGVWEGILAVGGVSQGGGACARPTITTCIPPGGCVSRGLGVRRYVCDDSAFSSLPRRKS